METLTVSIEGDVDGGLSLTGWLRQDQRTRGEVEIAPGAVPPGKLGTTLDVLELLLAKGGAVGAVIFALMQWARTRRSTVTLTVKRGKNVVTFSAKQVQLMTAEQIQKLAQEVLREPED